MASRREPGPPGDHPDPEDLLGRVGLFRRLRPDQRRKIADVLESRSFPAGASITRHGEMLGDMHLIVAGDATVNEVDGESSSTLGPGSCIGELVAIEPRPAARAIAAATPMECLVLTSHKLYGVMRA